MTRGQKTILATFEKSNTFTAAQVLRIAGDANDTIRDAQTAMAIYAKPIETIGDARLAMHRFHVERATAKAQRKDDLYQLIREARRLGNRAEVDELEKELKSIK